MFRGRSLYISSGQEVLCNLSRAPRDITNSFSGELSPRTVNRKNVTAAGTARLRWVQQQVAATRLDVRARCSRPLVEKDALAGEPLNMFVIEKNALAGGGATQHVCYDVDCTPCS